jgi:hypothetical protein
MGLVLQYLLKYMCVCLVIAGEGFKVSDARLASSDGATAIRFVLRLERLRSFWHSM